MNGLEINVLDFHTTGRETRVPPENSKENKIEGIDPNSLREFIKDPANVLGRKPLKEGKGNNNKSKNNNSGTGRGE